MKVILITPTHNIGPEGYYEATIQMADSTITGYNPVGKPWHSDSVHFHGELQMDFENNGNIVIWNPNDELIVKEAYTTRIFGGNKSYDEYYKR